MARVYKYRFNRYAWIALLLFQSIIGIKAAAFSDRRENKLKSFNEVGDFQENGKYENIEVTSIVEKYMPTLPTTLIEQEHELENKPNVHPKEIKKILNQTVNIDELKLNDMITTETTNVIELNFNDIADGLPNDLSNNKNININNDNNFPNTNTNTNIFKNNKNVHNKIYSNENENTTIKQKNSLNISHNYTKFPLNAINENGPTSQSEINNLHNNTWSIGQKIHENTSAKESILSKSIISPSSLNETIEATNFSTIHKGTSLDNPLDKMNKTDQHSGRSITFDENKIKDNLNIEYINHKVTEKSSSLNEVLSSKNDEIHGKFFNLHNNSTNIQKLSLPDIIEAWTLAGMKSIPQMSNITKQRQHIGNIGNVFKPIQYTKMSNIADAKEKNLLDWSQIMMKTELMPNETKTRINQLDIDDKNRKDNHSSNVTKKHILKPFGNNELLFTPIPMYSSINISAIEVSTNINNDSASNEILSTITPLSITVPTITSNELSQSSIIVPTIFTTTISSKTDNYIPFKPETMTVYFNDSSPVTNSNRRTDMKTELFINNNNFETNTSNFISNTTIFPIIPNTKQSDNHQNIKFLSNNEVEFLSLNNSENYNNNLNVNVNASINANAKVETDDDVTANDYDVSTTAVTTDTDMTTTVKYVLPISSETISFSTLPTSNVNATLESSYSVIIDNNILRNSFDKESEKEVEYLNITEIPTTTKNSLSIISIEKTTTTIPDTTLSQTNSNIFTTTDKNGIGNIENDEYLYVTQSLSTKVNSNQSRSSNDSAKSYVDYVVSTQLNEPYRMNSEFQTTSAIPLKTITLEKSETTPIFIYSSNNPTEQTYLAEDVNKQNITTKTTKIPIAPITKSTKQQSLQTTLKVETDIDVNDNDNNDNDDEEGTEKTMNEENTEDNDDDNDEDENIYDGVNNVKSTTEPFRTELIDITTMTTITTKKSKIKDRDDTPAIQVTSYIPKEIANILNLNRTISQANQSDEYNEIDDKNIQRNNDEKSSIEFQSNKNDILSTMATLEIENNKDDDESLITKILYQQSKINNSIWDNTIIISTTTTSTTTIQSENKNDLTIVTIIPKNPMPEINIEMKNEETYKIIENTETNIPIIENMSIISTTSITMLTTPLILVNNTEQTLSETNIPMPRLNIDIDMDMNHSPTTYLPSTSIVNNPDINAASFYPKNTDSIDINVIIAITISVIGVIALILLVGFLYLMRKRQKSSSYSQRCRPVSLDDYTIDNISIYNSMRTKNSASSASKRSHANLAFDDPSLRHNILDISSLGKFVLDKSEIYEEFRDVPQVRARPDEVPVGCEEKNRYANVVPLPETRVLLQRMNDDAKTEYINANYVRGPKDVPNYYIACQAPLENTIEDFWRMIWEQQSRVLIQATDLVENGVEKCAEYLPPSVTLDNHSTFGDFHVILQNREVKNRYAISTILLKHNQQNTSREITHYWYKWPETGVPNEEAPLIAMLLEVRSSLISYANETNTENKISLIENNIINNNDSITNSMIPSSTTTTITTPIDKVKNITSSTNTEINGNMSTPTPTPTPTPTTTLFKKTVRNQGPLTVHCSPGTGRTGTIIACDIAIRCLEMPKRTVDIPQIVYYVRHGRASSIPTKEQYEFIYKISNMYATKITSSSNERENE